MNAAYRPVFVEGRCPACDVAALFVGSGGYVTCGYAACPDPTAVDVLLHGGSKKGGGVPPVETPEGKRPVGGTYEAPPAVAVDIEKRAGRVRRATRVRNWRRRS